MQVIDAKGKKIIPGLIDTHTHHRDPGFTHKEDITTATMAAAAGGVTLSIGMPNVNPPTTTVERYRALVEHHSKNAIVDFNHNPSGTVPEEIPGLAKEGPLAFKIFMVKDTGRDYPHMPGIGINNNGELFKCFEAVGQTGLPLMVHPHDQDLMDEIEGRYWKKEDRSPQAYAKAYRDYDGIIWDTAMATLFRMQKALGAQLHILHMTTPEGLAMLRRAKDEGRPCSLRGQSVGDVSGDLGERREAGTVLPGFLGAAGACGRALEGNQRRHGRYHRHRPRAAYERRKRQGLDRHVELSRRRAADPGLSPPVSHRGQRRQVTLDRLVRISSYNAAKIFNVYPRKGVIQPGSDADMVIVDMNKEEIISNDTTYTKVGWTPYNGRKVKGAPVRTIVRGKTVMLDGKIIGKPGDGQLIKPLRARISRLWAARSLASICHRGLISLIYCSFRIDLIDDQPGGQFGIKVGRLLRHLLAAGDDRLDLFGLGRVQNKRRLKVFLLQRLQHGLLVLRVTDRIAALLLLGRHAENVLEDQQMQACSRRARAAARSSLLPSAA